MENLSNKKKKVFVTGAIILAIAGLLCKIIGALFRIPLRNMMGVAGMTYYSTVYPYYSALIVVATSGLPTAVSKLVSERVSLGDGRGAQKVFKQSLLLLLFIGLFTTFLMFFGANFLAKATNCPGSEKSFRALAPALLIVSVMCAFRGYLQGLQKMTGTALSQLMEQVGKLFISLLLVKKLLPKGFDVAAAGALLGITISEFLALIVIFAFYVYNKKHDSIQYDDKIDDGTNYLKPIFQLAIPITIGAAIMPLTGIMDTLLIKNIMLDTGFTREYADMCFAVFRTDVSTVINMPAALTIALSMSLVPAISESLALKDYSRSKQVATMGIKLAMFVGLPCAVGLFIIGGEVIDFLFKVTPEELATGTSLMKISSIGIVFLSMVQTLTGCIQGHGKPNVPVIFLSIGAVFKIITMYLLMRIPSLNINGAAISTVVCYAIAGILDLIYLIRISKLNLNFLQVFGKPIAASLLMGIVVYLTRSLFLKAKLSSALVAVASILIGIVFYLLFTLLFRTLDNDELKLIPGGNKVIHLMNKFGLSK